MRDHSDFTRGVDFHDIFMYTVVTLASNFFGSFTTIFLSMMFFNFAESAVIFALYLIVPTLTAVLVTANYFRNAVERQCTVNGGTRSWLACGLWLILPGEIVRMIVSFLGGISRFACVPANIYASIAGDGRLRIETLFAVYIVYLVLYVAILLFFYRRRWRKIELEYGMNQRKE